MFSFWKRSLAKRVSPEELKHALSLIGPVSGNAKKGIDRGLEALSEEYGNDSEKLKSITHRITALFSFLEDSMELVGGKRKFRKGYSFHTAVLEAAAEHPVESDGTFEENGFLDRVKRIREERYGEEVKL